MYIHVIYKIKFGSYSQIFQHLFKKLVSDYFSIIFNFTLAQNSTYYRSEGKIYSSFFHFF